MADYEDQNSSEYKDMNQETQAADQNPQNGQPIPPQNNGQDPYWQNHRMTDRSRLRILDRIHTGRISRTADSSHRRTDSRRIGRISTITDNRPTGRTSRSARDAKRTPSRRSP